MKAEKKPDLKKAAHAIERFLQALGHGPDSDPELRETGMRVAKAFSEDLLSGYSLSAKDILSECTHATTKGLVVLSDIPVTMMCPHHLLPATGVAHVGYVPGATVVGLGALGDLLDCFSRRLTLQEAVAEQVTTALMKHLGAKGAGCVIELSQACVVTRGARRHGARTTVTQFAGTLARDPSMRKAFVAALRSEKSH